MIYFCDGAGVQVKCFPSRVFQGSAEANEVILCAPFAQSAQVSVSFRLPDGESTPRMLMQYEGSAEAYDGAGTMLRCWSAKLPAAVTARYGEAEVQFFRIAASEVLACGTGSALRWRGELRPRSRPPRRMCTGRSCRRSREWRQTSKTERLRRAPYMPGMPPLLTA